MSRLRNLAAIALIAVLSAAAAQPQEGTDTSTDASLSTIYSAPSISRKPGSNLTSLPVGTRPRATLSAATNCDDSTRARPGANCGEHPDDFWV